METHQYLMDCDCGIPLVIEDVVENFSFLIDIGVVNLLQTFDIWGIVWVV